MSSGALQGKVVVVSGVGPGLGRSIALQSARAGADVVLAARTEARLDGVAAEVEGIGRRALTVSTDITDDASSQRLLDATLAEFGQVDALVNNAFAIPPMTDLMSVDFDKTRSGFETNVFGALRMTRQFAPALAASSGAVVMINSSVLRHSSPPYGAYKMSKAALLALAQSLATELGPQGIRVNTVAPGYIWADTLQGYFAYLASKRGVQTQVIYDETAAKTDLRRLPEPDQIADAVVFMASDMSRAITGHCLDVNCGEFHH
ncbi:MAG TPA: SDR family oxidoreductase [Jatrophihabitantaceae bacterium]|jgi:NAD(P)-dependent dehydrogenase (short-subunit alcohol dehydrogenase family)|nr:SDR family oxidoreductase [Jatrophihabitantaceae bacterium]